MKYTIEMLVKGEWKVWNVYKDSDGYRYDAKERCEMGLKIARCYGECRVFEEKED